MRSQWTSLTDELLLAQCAVDTYRASGPGGQKRNKTSSAVRLRHAASGQIVIAEESRSQHENRARAVKRLRRRFYLVLREPFHSTAAGAPQSTTDLKVGLRDQRFWPTAGRVLDALEGRQGRVSETAALFGVSTGQLVDFLSREPELWQQANVIRQAFGQRLLKDN
jgi:hypothetical protein